MRTSKIGLALFLLFPITGSFAAPSPQTNSSTPQLSDFNAPDWHQRWAAYEKIKDNQEATKRPDVRGALFNLLERENQVIHQTRVNSNGKLGVSDKYGEEYTEYYADLLGTVAKLADWHDRRQVCILAQGSYNPDSPFATQLAAEGGAVVAPCLLKMAQSNEDENDRYESIPVLVHLSGITGLSLPDRERIQQAIVAGLHDRSIGVRLTTVRAVGQFGTPQMTPILQEIARSDPASRPINEGKESRFDVREAAEKAIRSIQERAKIN